MGLGLRKKRKDGVWIMTVSMRADVALTSSLALGNMSSIDHVWLLDDCLVSE